MKKIGLTASVFLLGLAFATPAAAQPKPAAPKPPAEAAKPGETAKPPAETAPARPAVSVNEGLPVNVRLEITITDQRGGAEPIVKTVTKTVADRSWIRIRTGADVQTKMGYRPVVLNIDSYPRVIPTSPGSQTPSSKLKVDITIDYRPVAAEADTEKSTTPSINESLTIILEDGKSLVISQSADPATDRKVKVEAKATILK
jgi:hypothetical protein